MKTFLQNRLLMARPGDGCLVALLILAELVAAARACAATRYVGAYEYALPAPATNRIAFNLRGSWTSPGSFANAVRVSGQYAYLAEQCKGRATTCLLPESSWAWRR
jgi:hypothetical protein